VSLLIEKHSQIYYTHLTTTLFSFFKVMEFTLPNHLRMLHSVYRIITDLINVQSQYKLHHAFSTLNAILIKDILFAHPT